MSPRRRIIDNESLAQLSNQRREVLGRAVRILETDREVPIDIAPDALRETTALLTVSLEELKVAEEELRQQNEELIATREAVEEAGRHFQRLFDEAPLPYVVTDGVGMVRHANRAAAVLLKRPAELLEGKPLINFVPLERRPAFREAINRLQLVDIAHDWRTTLLRHGDAPVQVVIDAKLAPGARDGEDLICWIIRPASAAGAGAR